MTLSLPSLDLGGILIVGAVCLALGTAIGAAATVAVMNRRKGCSCPGD